MTLVQAGVYLSDNGQGDGCRHFCTDIQTGWSVNMQSVFSIADANFFEQPVTSGTRAQHSDIRQVCSHYL